MVQPHTFVVSTPTAGSIAQLDAASPYIIGRQVVSAPALVGRLAGGFLQPPSRDAIQEAVGDALQDDGLGDLDAIRPLPGMRRAVVATLERVWHGNLSLANDQGTDAFGSGDNAQRRRASLRTLEERVIARLPAAMEPPNDIAERARFNLSHAAAILGPVVLDRVPDVEPCWRQLLSELAEHVNVTWRAATRPVPDWVRQTRMHIETEDAANPDVRGETCATPRHEVVEAVRWARELIATGRARPQDIAFVAADPSTWDPHMLSIAADANLDVHFTHGRPVTVFPTGQTCAALAEVLLNGLSRERVRRLIALVRGQSAMLARLPEDWAKSLPPGVPLVSYAQWEHLLEQAAADPDGADLRDPLLDVIALLAGGPERAVEAGEQLLTGHALAVWRKALHDGPARALDVTLQTLRTDDGLEPGAHIAWMRAEDLAAAPRSFVRLLGMTRRGWPREHNEDPLLPQHIVDPDVLDPVPVPERDRRDFAAIKAATDTELVLSRARRTPDGRLQGASPLWPDQLRPTYRKRTRTPAHAASESDRLLARPQDFATTRRASHATACWRAWHRHELTPHDGLVRRDHPVIAEALNRPQSATSLGRLLRDPLGYVWAYAFRWQLPVEDEEPLTLDALEFGSLVHSVLEDAVHRLEAQHGLARADNDTVQQAVGNSVRDVAARWETERPTPPPLVWKRTQRTAADMAVRALTIQEAPLDGQTAWPEVPFGGKKSPNAAERDLPWDPNQDVHIPRTTVRIAGVIDRLDLSADHQQARVTDYKTGKRPKDIDKRQLNGGRELQRCLYAFAVRNLLGQIPVEARLAYPVVSNAIYPMEDTVGALTTLAGYVQLAEQSLREGHAVIGPESQSDWNDFAFALPGNAKVRYFHDKDLPARTALGELVHLWDMA